MKRYKISFEYLGLEFSGSQIQKNGRTIQAEIQNAICTLTKNNNTKVIMAGRTDKCVSAKCQTAHFDADFLITDLNKFLYSMNSILPYSIRVFDIESVVASFHAQKSATYRHYQYKIDNSPFKKSVFDQNVFHTRRKLSAERMNEALSYIIGQHDFSAFKSVSLNPAKICNVYFAKAVKDADYILIDIVANRFLYNMVRAIAGTLFMIEFKNLDPSYMKKVLDLKERNLAGANADPIGLTLIKTGYDDPESYKKEQFNMKGIINENL